MHELGIMYHIVRTVENAAKENKVCEIAQLVLEIGDEAGVVPKYIRECFPVAASGTILENTQLEIELLPGRQFNIKQIVAR